MSDHDEQSGTDPGPINPAWWRDVLPPSMSETHVEQPADAGPPDPEPSGAHPTDYESSGPDPDSEMGGSPGWRQPEVLSGDLAALAAAAPTDSLQRKVTSALADASSAMLEPEDWAEPFRPFIQWEGGARSVLPSDLDDERLALLAAAAPVLDHLPMRARAADVAWTYGDRSNSELLDLAIDAYLSTPLERMAWHRLSGDSWRRAIELMKRRGKAESARLEAALTQITSRILEGSASDGFMLVDLADLLRRSGNTDADTTREVADQFVTLAGQAGNPRLGRHLERAAQRFLLSLGDQEAVHAATVRIAALYEADAEQRLASGNASVMAAGIFLEKAIGTLKTLPRRYRLTEGIDQRIDDLRRWLHDNREATLEAMIRIESDPVDITGSVIASQQEVRGLPRFEALVRLAIIHPLTDSERAYADARAANEGTLARLFGRSTFTADGRKVASVPGATGDPDESETWSSVLRNFGIRVGLVAQACIIPALDVVAMEHRFDMPFLTRLCWDSPMVPPNHVDLWARGLWHGLRGDFPSAISVLVPQAEQLLRHSLKRTGVNTLTVDPVTGVESEKALGALLAMDDAVELLGPGLRLELRALLVEQEGPNLRNDTAHGLLTDGAAWSASAVYAWWLLLRLVVVPLWYMLAEASASADSDSSAGSGLSQVGGSAAGTGNPG